MISVTAYQTADQQATEMVLEADQRLLLYGVAEKVHSTATAALAVLVAMILSREQQSVQKYYNCVKLIVNTRFSKGVRACSVLHT